jgi:hypothetical protein
MCHLDKVFLLKIRRDNNKLPGILLVLMFLLDKNILLDMVNKQTYLFNHHNILQDNLIQYLFLWDNKIKKNKVFHYEKFRLAFQL